MRSRTDLDHALQLRLSKNTVAEIDNIIGSIPQLCGFSRCKFIRAAVKYTLYSIAEESQDGGKNLSGMPQENEQ